MQLSDVRPSVLLSVCPIRRRTPLLRVCCCGPGDQEVSVHRPFRIQYVLMFYSQICGL